MNGERTAAAPRTFPDDWIERWAPVFLEEPNRRLLRAHGVAFETFLLAPEEILAALGATPRTRLLPAQRAVQARLDASASAARHQLLQEALGMAGRTPWITRVENGRQVQKLRHHAHPRNVHA